MGAKIHPTAPVRGHGHQRPFRDSGQYVRSDGVFWTASGVITSYAAALLASALMLWFFRRFEGGSLIQMYRYNVERDTLSAWQMSPMETALSANSL